MSNDRLNRLVRSGIPLAQALAVVGEVAADSSLEDPSRSTYGMPPSGVLRIPNTLYVHRLDQ